MRNLPSFEIKKGTEDFQWPNDVAQPNLFLVGFPKCGTTSLAAWLAQHPQVHFSDPKEPHFFNTDHGYRVIRRPEDYVNLFRAADPARHSIIAEGSVWYLQSDRAIPQICSRWPNARFVVLTREPVSFAQSLHEQQVRSFFEDQHDFAKAWRLSAQRRQRNGAPRAPEPTHLDYEDLCAQGRYLRRLLDAVPRERVFVGDLADLTRDPAQFMSRLFDFLGVEQVGHLDLSARNAGRVARSHMLARGLYLLNGAKKQLGLRFSTGALNYVKRLNLSVPQRAMSDALCQEITDQFRQDRQYVTELLRTQGSDMAAELRR